MNTASLGRTSGSNRKVFLTGPSTTKRWISIGGGKHACTSNRCCAGCNARPATISACKGWCFTVCDGVYSDSQLRPTGESVPPSGIATCGGPQADERYGQEYPDPDIAGV